MTLAGSPGGDRDVIWGDTSASILSMSTAAIATLLSMNYTHIVLVYITVQGN